jgi:hypothetical protein
MLLEVKNAILTQNSGINNGNGDWQDSRCLPNLLEALERSLE